MEHMTNPMPPDQPLPTQRDEGQVLQALEEALEGFSRSVRLQEQCLALLAGLNDAAVAPSVLSGAMEKEVSRLMVERLMHPEDGDEPGIGEK